MTASEAIALIPEWQKRLRLQDWTIRGVVVDQTENNPCGKVNQLNDYKDALVTILNPENIPASWLGNRDPEVTVVHELLHLQGESLNGFLNEKKHARYSNDYERLVELTAIALVALKRELLEATREEREARQGRADHGVFG